MEGNYQNLEYTDDEKVMAYLRAIIKAVEKTHQVTAKAENKSQKAKEAIGTKDKVYMWSTLQEYLYKYRDYISKTNKICICRVDMEFYNQIAVKEIEKQLKIMIGVVYDYEAKYCLHNEVIKQCLKKLLKESNMFTDKEVERLLL